MRFGLLHRGTRQISAIRSGKRAPAAQAVLEGQRLEGMRDEAGAEVFRACRALGTQLHRTVVMKLSLRLAQLSHIELLGKSRPKRRAAKVPDLPYMG